MNDEALSALLDGECTPAEVDRLLAEMEANPALKARFSRMCLARDSRHGTRVREAHLGFSDRVMAALEGRPAVNVVPLLPARLRRAAQRAGWRPAMGGLAAAAAVAAIAVLAVRPAPVALPAVGGHAQPVETGAIPGPVTDADLLPVSYRRWTQLDADNMRELNNYFMTYSNSRGEHGMGALGYARYAATPTQTPPPPTPVTDPKQ